MSFTISCANINMPTFIESLRRFQYDSVKARIAENPLNDYVTCYKKTGAESIDWYYAFAPVPDYWPLELISFQHPDLIPAICSKSAGDPNMTIRPINYQNKKIIAELNIFCIPFSFSSQAIEKKGNITRIQITVSDIVKQGIVKNLVGSMVRAYISNLEMCSNFNGLGAGVFINTDKFDKENPMTSGIVIAGLFPDPNRSDVFFLDGIKEDLASIISRPRV